MGSYIVRRIIYMIVVLLIVSFISFAILKLLPFEPTDLIIRDPNIREQIEERHGLRDPFWLQYLKWLRNVLQGNFGVYVSPSGEASEVSDRLFGRCLIGEKCYWSNTLIIVLATLLFTWLIGVPLGIYSATHKGSTQEHSLAFLGCLWLGLPHFLLALLASWVMFVTVHKSLSVVDNFSKFMSWKFLLFIFIIGAANIAFIMRHMRSSLLDILNAEYIRAARAKGLSERIVVYKHALKNALNPLISMFGSYIPRLFEGILIAAVIFSLPLVELQYWEAFGKKQPYMVASGLLFFSFMLLAGNFFADLLLLWINPRIRYEE